MSENYDKIDVRVLFFGAAREAAGADEVTIETDFPATVTTVKQEIFARYEEVSHFAKSLMIAVNQEYATDDTVVRNRDEIAFLPPVSGG